MNHARTQLPMPVNEPVKEYEPGSPERETLIKELKRQMENRIEIPVMINGTEIFTGNTVQTVCPHQHGHVLASCHQAGPKEIRAAIDSAMAARQEWASFPYQERASIFLKAAELISKKYTHVLNAATMLGQSKNVFQAEIDATCELADFFRFNAWFMEEIYSQQPESEKGVWNRIDYRPLEGFVFALSPFNFTAIAGNLSSAPAMMGNTVVWKPSGTAVLSGYYLTRLFKEAGLPDGVINFIPGSGAEIGNILLAHQNLGGIHFTGSTAVFQNLWQGVGQNIRNYSAYPRLVGETGGKDYIFIHPSADLDQAATAAIRGAFEYQGQKCSACSRLYVPKSCWNGIKEKLIARIEEIRTGDVMDFRNFCNAVIDKKAFDTITGYIQRAQRSPECEILAGGHHDNSIGYFIDPTLIRCRDPFCESMREEIFGPVLSIFVYDDDQLAQTLDLLDSTTAYALTGAVFATDRKAINEIMERLKFSAGNFYINDKPTGAVVGQQPFGGSRASGTNDKAGSSLNLLRWTTPRTIKETFVPPIQVAYPFMAH